MYKCALILAAGQGKRIKSDLPKVLHKVCGKEMVNHVIDTLRKSKIEDINVIVGKGAELVKSNTSSRNVSYSLQEEQLGTGHAVKCAMEFLKDKSGTVAVFNGDAPLIKEDTIVKLFKIHEENNNSATILTSILDDASGYGRIIRSGDEVLKIVEHKDCNEEELKVKEINSGIYCFEIEKLVECLGNLSTNNSQGEYYLTDVIEMLKDKNEKVGALIIDYEETLGVNSRLQLSEVEVILRKRINNKHLDNGITIIDPMTTYIGADVEIGQDTIIYPGNVLEGNTKIGKGCTLFPNSRINNSIIGKNVEIQSSVILDSSVGNNTKVSHLTYVGDSEVGESCNFGCGTVTVNYDGTNKHKTVIGNNSFIGCNTNLISPVTIEDNSYIAAGSTITNDVHSGELAVARAKQRNIEGWVDKRGLIKKK